MIKSPYCPGALVMGMPFPVTRRSVSGLHGSGVTEMSARGIYAAKCTICSHNYPRIVTENMRQQGTDERSPRAAKTENGARPYPTTSVMRSLTGRVSFGSSGITSTSHPVSACSSVTAIAVATRMLHVSPKCAVGHERGDFMQ